MFYNYPDIVTAEQTAQMLGVGKSSVYALLRCGQIRHVKLGRKYLIPKQSVIDFVNHSCYTDAQIIHRRPSIEKGAQ